MPGALLIALCLPFVSLAATLVDTCGAAENDAPWTHAGPATYNDFTVPANMTSAGAIQASVLAGGNKYPSRWLVGFANGGVWSTPASNISSDLPAWNPRLDGQPVNCYSISALAVSAFDPDVVFAGCGGSTSSEEGDDWNVVNDGNWGGVMVSSDAGLTWKMTSFPPNHFVTGIVAVDAQTTIVSTRSSLYDPNDGGVWKSTGDEWQKTLPYPAFGLAYDAKGSKRIFAALALESRTVFMSGDLGTNWVDWSDGVEWPSNHVPFYPCMAVAHGSIFLGGLTVNKSDPTSTDTVIFSRSLEASSGRKTSATWKPLSRQQKLDDDAMPKDRMAILPDPNNASLLYLAGNGGHIAFRVNLESGDWTPLVGADTVDNSQPHCDCRSLAFNAELNELVLTSDGGVFARSKPQDQGGRWRSLNGDIKGMEMLSAHWDASLDRWIGGAQDNDVQVAPPQTTSGSRSYGVVMGDGTITAVDNTVAPARLFGARQCLGIGPDDETKKTQKGRSTERLGEKDVISSSDDDDDMDQGLAFVEGSEPMLRVGIDLGEFGFEDPHCFPYFVQPYALNSQSPTQLVFWANCSAGEEAGDVPPSGWYALDIPHGIKSQDQLEPPKLLVGTEGEVYSFVAGGFTRGQSDDSLLVGINGTHLHYYTAAGAAGSQVLTKALPTKFAPPVVFDIRDGETVVGPISHDKTVSLAVSPRDSSIIAVTGWPSVKVNDGIESIWVTMDAGDSWKNATGNILDGVERARPSGLLIIDFVKSQNHSSSSNQDSVSALLVGTTSGAYVSWTDKLGLWTRIGSCDQLPLIMVKGLSYEHFSDTLVAATMGRGVYVMRKAKAILLQMRPDLLEKGFETGSSERYFASKIA